MMLTGGLNDENFDDVLESRIEEIRGERRRKLGTNGVLTIESRGNVEAKVEEPTRDFGEILICFDPIDEDALKEQCRHDITTIIASLGIATSGNYKTERLAEGIYLIDEAGKVIHPRFPRVGGLTVYSSNPIEQRIVEAVKEYSTMLTEARGLERVSNLFVQSMNLEHDDFRRFIFGWTALEILINKVFRNYERTFVDELVSGASVHGAPRYFTRITEVMKDKYRLVDKFSVIASILADESSDADIEQFKLIKGVRDDLFHGQDVLETSLPNAELQSLLSKYFRTHLDYISHTH
jgi:hypothetical protein